MHRHAVSLCSYKASASALLLWKEYIDFNWYVQQSDSDAKARRRLPDPFQASTLPLPLTLGLNRSSPCQDDPLKYFVQ